MAYTAFISYNHEVDHLLAAALRTSLQSFAKPWYRLRAVRIFRDTASLAPDSSLPASIERALSESEFLIVLASPESAQSMWVNREVQHWLKTRSIDTLILVLTHGDIVWDPTTRAFDSERTTSLGPALRGAYTSEPLYLDLRWIEDAEGRSLRHPRFREAVAGLSARLRHRPKDELIGEDVRSHRNAMRLAWTGGTLVLLLAVAAIIGAFVANQQRQEAVEQRRVADRRLLSVQAEQLLDQSPDLLPRSALLAIEALRTNAGPEAEQVLRRSLALLPRLVREIDAGREAGDVTALAFDQAGERLAIGGRRGLGLWQVETGDRIGEAGTLSVTSLEFDSPRPSLTALNSNRLVRLPLADLEEAEVLGPVPRQAVVGSGGGGWIAWPAPEGGVRVTPFEGASDPIELQFTEDPTERPRAIAVTLSRDHTTLAAANRDGEIHLWSLPSGSRLQVINGSTDVSSNVLLSLTPSGDKVAAVRDGRVVEVWEVRAGVQVGRFDHGSFVGELAFAPDNALMAAGSGVARIWHPDGHELFRIPYEGSLEAIAFGFDGRILATGHRAGKVRIWDLTDRLGELGAVAVTEVNAVAVSPDSRYLATAEDNGLARIWDVETGRELQRIVHPPAFYSSRIDRLMFTPDGSELVRATIGSESTTWRLADGQQVASFSTPAGLLGGSQIGPQGRLVATLTDLRQTEVWDIRRGQRVASLEHGGTGWRPLLSPDSRLVAIKRQSELYVWTIASGEQVAYAEIDPELEINAVEFSPDSSYVAFGGDDERVTVWDLQQDIAVARMPHEAEVLDLHFAADGRHLATHSVGGTVRVFAREGWPEVAEFPHALGVVDLAMDDSRVATADEGGTVRVWEVPSGRILREIAYDDEVQLVSLKPGSDILGVAGVGSLGGFSIRTGQAVIERQYLARVTAYAQSTGGDLLAVGLGDGGTEVWDLGNQRPLLTLEGQGEPADVMDVVFSADGQRLATAADRVHIWDVTTGSELARVQSSGFGTTIALSPDGRYLALGDSAADLSVWDAATSELLFRVEHDASIGAVDFSPDARLVAATSPVSEWAYVWQVDTGERVRAVSVGAQGRLLGVAFHPDLTRLATAGGDGSIRFWDLGSGAEVGRILQGGSITAIAFSDDGRFMATTSADYLARVWEVDSNALVAMIPHEAATRSLALSREGRLLATINARDDLRLWRLDHERLIDDACNRVGRNLTWGEWQQYLGDASPYRKTCAQLPIHSSFLAAALEMAQAGDADGARAQWIHAAALEPEMDFDVARELESIALYLDTEGVSAAETGEVGRAAQRFEASTRLIDDAPYDFGERARAIAIAARVEEGVELAMDGQAADAIVEFDRAREIDPSLGISATFWNALCWFGTVYEQATEVIDACDRAVDLAEADRKGFFADARGVARLLTGDTPGALADFEMFLDLSSGDTSMSDLLAVRRGWVEALRSGVDPLDGMNLLALGNAMTPYRTQLGLHWQYVTIEAED